MDYQKRVSVLEGEDQFLTNRSILSRNSSLGCSSRISYYRSAEGIPFKWEMQPGTPINKPQEDIIPPISPPPAVLSLGLPKPCINVDDEPKGFSMRSKLMNLKQIIVSRKNHHNKSQGIVNNKKIEAHEDHVYEFGSDYSDDPFRSSLSDGDREFLSSSPCNSSSSYSSSSSVSNFQPADDDHRDRAGYGCSPWRFSSFRGRMIGKKV